MKKLLFVITIALCLSSCGAEKKKNAALNGSKSSLLNITDNGDKKSERTQTSEFETYPHNQTLLVYSQEIVVFNEPFTTDKSKSSYVTKKDDILQIENVLYSDAKKKTSLQVNLDSGLTGYIPLSKNPYKNGDFSYKEQIDVNGNIVTVLNRVKNYTIAGYSDSPKNVMKMPSDSSECLFSIADYITVSSTCITSDYKWIYITTDSGSGWIKTEYISQDIGGPVLMTPEECINEELVWAYER